MKRVEFTIKDIPGNSAAIMQLTAPEGIAFSGPIPDSIELKASADFVPDLSAHIDLKVIIDVAVISKVAVAAWLVSKLPLFVRNTHLEANGQKILVNVKDIAGNIEQQVAQNTHNNES